jgi:hypothetical protein
MISCNNKSTSPYDKIQGTWQTTAINIDHTGNVPMSILKDSETLALASSITFRNDTTYVRNIKNNQVSQLAIRTTGKFEFPEENKLVLTILNYEIKREGEDWTVLNPSQTGSVYETSEYTIDEFTSDEIKITTDGGFDTSIHYTWSKE